MNGDDDKLQPWIWDAKTALERVEAISANARTTWFALLGLLTFTLITLLSVKDIDFFGYGRATALPLVNIEVPTTYFFIAAPVLIAALYGYFHFYLLRHWDVLRCAPPQSEGRAFGEMAHPWLLTDMALRMRKDGAAVPRALSPITDLTVGLLTWAYGWIVLFYAWWRAMPAHDPLLTFLNGACLIFALMTGWTSLVMLWRRMKEPSNEDASVWRQDWWFVGLLGIILILSVGNFRTTTNYEKLTTIFTELTPAGDFMTAPANLESAFIAIRPVDWMDYAAAETAARRIWCSRRDLEWTYCKKNTEDFEDKQRIKWCAGLNPSKGEAACTEWFARQEYFFQDEWQLARRTAIKMLQKPEFGGRDLRGANLRAAFLTGVKLEGAQMQGANLSEAQMQGANFSKALTRDALFVGAQMQDVNLLAVQMQRANFSGADMEGAGLLMVKMQDAEFVGTNLQGTNLMMTNMQGANLMMANMHGANLQGAQILGTNFSGTVGLTQETLLNSVGNKETILPHSSINRDPLYTFSCLQGNTLASQYHLEKQFEISSWKTLIPLLCPDNAPPHKTGRSAETGFVYGHSPTVGPGL